MSNEEMVASIKKGDNALMQDLYVENLPLIRKIIYPYIKNDTDIEDCLQEAFFGLCDAVERYDSCYDVKFMTFAKWYIVHSVQTYLCNSSFFRLPQHFYQKMMKYKKAYAILSENGEKPTPERIFALTDLSEYEQETICFIIRGVESLDKPLETSDGDSLSIQDVIASDVNVEENTVDAIYKENMQELWQTIKDNLSEVESDTIIQRYRYSNSLQAIADQKGITRERVRQIEASAFRHIRIRCRKLLNVYADTEGLLYRDGLSHFKNKQESMIESVVVQRIEAEENYKRHIEEIENRHRERIKAVVNGSR